VNMTRQGLVRKYSSLQNRLYLLGTLILVAGLACAAFVYLTSKDDVSDAIAYEFAGGNIYSTQPDESKRYIQDVELYGGKPAVVADDLNRWFGSLWHGRQLAYTLATLSIGLATTCFLAASYLAHHTSPNQAEDPDD
jgi:hypothetical protein